MACAAPAACRAGPPEVTQGSRGQLCSSVASLWVGVGKPQPAQGAQGHPLSPAAGTEWLDHGGWPPDLLESCPHGVLAWGPLPSGCV